MATPYPPLPPDATPAQRYEYERNRWNHLLLDNHWRRTRFNAVPNKLLVETVRNLPPGAALDVNMGEGRNALLLAREGWQVTGVDYAEKALEYAQQQAAAAGLVLTTVAQDSTTFNWGSGCWELIVLCYADEQPHAIDAYAALRPGGWVVFENFHTDVNQARNILAGQEIGFNTDEVRSAYAAAGFQVVRYAEPLSVADFSLETQRLVQLVAQKR